jgi:hypothetical protein
MTTTFCPGSLKTAQDHVQRQRKELVKMQELRQKHRQLLESLKYSQNGSNGSQKEWRKLSAAKNGSYRGQKLKKKEKTKILIHIFLLDRF